MPRQPDYGCLDCNFRWSRDRLPVDAITKARFKVWENGTGFLEDMKMWVYEILPGGKVVEYTYYGRSCKYSERGEVRIPVEQISRLYSEIQAVIAGNPDDVVFAFVCDGSSFDLQVSYTDGRKANIKGAFDTVLLKISVNFLSDFSLKEDPT